MRPCSPRSIGNVPWRKWRARAVWVGLAGALAALFSSGHAGAAPPTAEQIVTQMKAALEPDKPSIRRMTMTVHQGSETRPFTLVQARKRLPDGARSLTVLLEPDDAKGLAYLVAEKQPGETESREWLYLPVVRRVRELAPAENYTSFLGSDLTYGDLGFLDTGGTTKLLGIESIDGRKAYKIESTPGGTTKQWYYARIVTWVDPETLLPIVREFYSPSGMRFKVERFKSVSRVDGIPTPFRLVMENLPGGTSTELSVDDVAYGVDIPDEYFGPDKLRTVAGLAFWGEKHGSDRSDR
jgi:outer membrane lipoprotein-sorting protein